MNKTLILGTALMLSSCSQYIYAPEAYNKDFKRVLNHFVYVSQPHETESFKNHSESLNVHVNESNYYFYGDCDDFASTIAHLLLANGEQQVYYLLLTNKEEAHVVVLVYDDKANGWIFDSSAESVHSLEDFTASSLAYGWSIKQKIKVK